MQNWNPWIYWSLWHNLPMIQCMECFKELHQYAFSIGCLPWRMTWTFGLFSKAISLCGNTPKVGKHQSLELSSKKRKLPVTKAARKSVAKLVNAWPYFLLWDMSCTRWLTHKANNPKLVKLCWQWPIWSTKYKMVTWLASSAETHCCKPQNMP